jgi:hypothetical protein
MDLEPRLHNNKKGLSVHITNWCYKDDPNITPDGHWKRIYDTVQL